MRLKDVAYLLGMKPHARTYGYEAVTTGLPPGTTSRWRPVVAPLQSAGSVVGLNSR